MKKVSLFLAVFLCLTIFTSCGNNETVYTAEDVAGKIYTYEKDGFGGPFTISIYEDGRFSYYVGLLSSYIGMGEWSVEDGILTLVDNTGLDYVNRFLIGENSLVFLAENSTGVMYLEMEDGDQFFGETLKLNSNVASSFFGGSGKTKYLVSLDEVRDLVLNHNCTEERLKELLEGFTCQDMEERWGWPDGMCSGLWCNFWNLDETNYIGVYYDGDGFVFEIRLGTKE